jgi:hypothetical protein
VKAVGAARRGWWFARVLAVSALLVVLVEIAMILGVIK